MFQFKPYTGGILIFIVKPRLGSISLAFTHVAPKSVRIQSSCKYLFMLLGSVCIKAACRTLMKLTPRGRFYQTFYKFVHHLPNTVCQKRFFILFVQKAARFCWNQLLVKYDLKTKVGKYIEKIINTDRQNSIKFCPTFLEVKLQSNWKLVLLN